MKRILIVIIALCLTLGLAACSNDFFENPGDTLGGGGTVDSTPAVPDTDELTDKIATLDTADTAVDLNTAWDGSAVQIVFSANGVTAGAGVTVLGTTATVSTAGTYVVSGTCANGRLVVAEKVEAHLIFNGLNLTSTTSAPVSLMKKAKRVITVAAGTVNTLTDASSYSLYDNADGDEPNGALFAKSDLTINGTGSLTVTGNCNNGISSKGNLKILNANVSVSANNNAVKGNDSVIIKNASITASSSGDGIKSDRVADDGTPTGFVHIENSTLNITANEDGIQADDLLYLAGNTATIKTGGGAAANTSNNTAGSRPGWNTPAATDETSRKGIKSDVSLYVYSGTYTLNCYDDAVHTNGIALIAGGDFSIQTGDDAVHADKNVVINGGTLDITKCYEGLEGTQVTINGGTVQIVASDDGINASDGSGETRPGQPIAGCSIIINGGNTTVTSGGDGLDSNGSILINGGTVTVHGPTSGADGALDADGGILVNGGTLLAGGALGMVETPAQNSEQNVLSVAFYSGQAAGTVITVRDTGGNTLVSYTSVRSVQSLIISTPQLVTGSSYTVYAGSTKVATVTISARITSAGTSSSGKFPR